MKRVVRERECYDRSGYCNQHRGRMKKKGLFPRRFKLNPEGGKYGAVGWDSDELDEWVEARAASRGIQAEPRAEAGMEALTASKGNQTEPIKPVAVMEPEPDHDAS